MKKYLIGLLFVAGQAWSQTLPVVESPSFKRDTFNIIEYGAKPDGVTLNTSALARAIEQCHNNGGGTVLVPGGFWLTGPFRLKSNVNLHISAGAVLQFSDNTQDYPLVRTNWEGLDAIRAHSPIYAVDSENIAITGAGIIDGAGQVWRPVKKSKLTASQWKDLLASGGVLNEKKDIWYPTEKALKGSLAKGAGIVAEGYDEKKAEAIREFLRPNMISLVRCTRVLLEGVTFQNSPAWCIHPLLTKHLTVRGIFVRNPWYAQNGDGLDIESCRYVLVEDSQFDVGDDGICIKSGRDEEGRKRGVPTEDVIVRNCTVFHGHGYGSGNNYMKIPPTYYFSFDTLDVRRDVTCGLYKVSTAFEEEFIGVNNASDPLNISQGKWSRHFLDVPPGKAAAKGTGINWPMMRYPDVLLMFAEAENELNGPTGEAQDALRRVRQRAFSPSEWATRVDGYISTVSSGKEAFFDAIVDERAWEFGGEMIRKYELIRWGNYSEKITEMVEALKQMTDEVVAGTSDLPDYLYWKRNEAGKFVVLNPNRKRLSAPDGWTRSAFLIDMQDNANTYDEWITRDWANYMGPVVRYIFPIPAEAIANSQGTLANDGYGFTGG